ncbi:MAG: acyl-CoA dehydrogenase family protein [Eggerthellaceae bacterium]
MDFKFTDEQELLVQSVKEYAGRYFAPEAVREMYGNHQITLEAAMAYREAGFMHMGLPEEVGGVPCDKTTMVLLCEQLHYHTGCVLPFQTDINSITDVTDFGTPEQVKLIMEAVDQPSTSVACTAISEPGAGSDNNAMTCHTVKQPNGTYLLNGQKTWVTLGEYAQYAIVIAKDESPAYENKAYSLWMVPKGAPGYTTAGLHKIGQEIVPFCDCFFDNVVLMEDQRIGAPGEGWKLLMQKFEFERVLVVAQALGQAQAAMDDAGAYVSDRICFGKPIGKISAIQHHLVEMEVVLQNVRSQLYRTVWKLDQGESIRLECALLKYYACPKLVEVADRALKIYAALGYTDEVRIGRLWKDIRGYEMAGGTPEVMEYIAGRQLVKKYAQ